MSYARWREALETIVMGEMGVSLDEIVPLNEGLMKGYCLSRRSPKSFYRDVISKSEITDTDRDVAIQQL